MAIADVLKDIGKGVATAGKVAAPVLERVAQVESGEAPQIDEETRKRQYAAEDQAIAQKAQILENNLAIGQKYGTLTPDQQQQYIDQITGLYSHPRHAATLMEKLRKAIHPQGAVAMAPQPSLANPIPEGGTAAADEANAQKLAQARYEAARKNNPKLAALDKFTETNYGTDYASSAPDQQEKALQAYVRASTKETGKPIPVSGNQIPADAVGPDGKPIPPEARTADRSFIEYHGAWYDAPKPKPIYRVIKGHLALMDPHNGLPMRDLGPVDGVKFSSRQQPFPSTDAQGNPIMRYATVTTVTTPSGESIDVEAPPPENPTQEGTATPGKTETKTPAKKVNVGSIVSKTGAKPSNVKTQALGPTIPGSEAWAARRLQTTADRQLLESSKQIISAVDDLMPMLESIKDKNNAIDLAKQDYEFGKYKMGLKPSGDWAPIFENAALLDVVGASIWSRIGRSKYTFEVIRQHLPKPTDSPALMYNKVKWLKENVVPAAQDAIKNPQPDQPGVSDDEFLLKVK